MSVTREERMQQVEARLDAARREAPDIAAAIDFYSALIGAMLDEESRVEPPSLDLTSVRHKFEAGEPILHGESLGMDEDGIRSLLVRLCQVTEQFGKVPAELNPLRLSWWQSYRAERDAAFARGVQAAKLRRALDRRELDFGALMDGLLGGSDDALASLAAKHGLDSDLMTTLARFAMRPTMRAFARALEPTVSALEKQWRNGVCPVCGSPSALSERSGQSQLRRMRCATCGTAWGHSTSTCPFCGKNQFGTLALPQLEGDDRHMLYGCAACKHYVKGIEAQDPLLDDLLPLEELLMLPLDAAAKADGYI